MANISPCTSGQNDYPTLRICNNRKRLDRRSYTAHTCVLLVAALWSSLCAAAEPQGCAPVEMAMQKVEAVRGLRATGPIPCELAARSDIERFLKETIARKLPPEKLKMEGIVYRGIGIVPDSYPYEERLVALYVTEIGGYYDPEKKRFVMASWLPATSQAPVARHELAHALQDQHYNLEAFLDPTIENGDELLARASLVEGDATAVMVDVEQREAKTYPRLSGADAAEKFSEGGELLSALRTQLQKTPPGLTYLMRFPYRQGERFVRFLIGRGGYGAVNQAFSRPPRASREILHPEEYVAGGFSPSIPPIECLQGEDPHGPQAAYTDTLGESGIEAALRSLRVDAKSRERAVRGWVGDRIGVFPKEGNQRRLVWVLRWETDIDAAEFLGAYRSGLENHYGKALRAGANDLSASKSIDMTIRPRETRLIFSIQEPAIPSTNTASLR